MWGAEQGKKSETTYQSKQSKPQVDDLLNYSGSVFNIYKHVPISSKISNAQVVIIRQNGGAFSSYRQRFKLLNRGDLWEIGNDHITGWSRK